MRTQNAPVTSPNARLDIRLFGHANVSFAGVPLKFAKHSTTLAMLACVLLKRGRPMPRESLAICFFPEVDEAAALAELRRYLYLANKALPACDVEPWLLLDAETVRWNERANAFVDVVEFERLSVSAETQGQAIDLYAGDLLEDVYDDWVLAERERLRSRYLALLNECLDRIEQVENSMSRSRTQIAFSQPTHGARTRCARSLRFATSRVTPRERSQNTIVLRNGCATNLPLHQCRTPLRCDSRFCAMRQCRIPSARRPARRSRRPPCDARSSVRWTRSRIDQAARGLGASGSRCGSPRSA